MRVTHVITRLIVGGAQENTIASVLGLREKPSMQLRLISGPSFGPEGSLETRVRAVPNLLTMVPELVRPIHPWKDCIALRRLAALFRGERPDIVHTHSGKAGLLGRLAAARARVPVVVHTIHGPSFGTFQGPAANLAFRAAERLVAKATTHFVVVADAMKQQYLAVGIGRPEQYTKIFSGFELGPFLAAKNDATVRRQLGLTPEDLVIGKIARLFKLKGHDSLFAVAPALVRNCPRIKFLLVGGGEWREKFENQISSLGLEKHFIFTGLVPPEKVPALVGVMDILVHLSSREGLARALPQALAAAKPVVAFDLDGASEVCIDGQTGYLLRPADMEGLRTRLLTLVNDPVLRQDLGRRGQLLVTERFSEERMVNDLYDLYLRLARREK